jgi:hypothetical protein
MRSYLTILSALLLISTVTHSQTVTELIMPQYVQGINATSTARVPFVCRLKFEGLQPNKTYRYFTRFISTSTSATASGEGNFISMNALTGNFKRITGPTLASTSLCDTLRTDAFGAFTGWFGNDAGTGAMFTPGSEVYIRVSLNDGNNGTTTITRLNTTSAIKVINFGPAATDGTALRSTPATGATAKNFVLLYDNTTGGAHPITATLVESDGVGLSTAGYATFYTTSVDAIDKAWGTIIPNDLTGGIKKIVQYSFAGSEVAGRVSSNGQWPTTGGTTVSTVTATGGTTPIVLDGSVVTLAPGTPIKLAQTITFPDLPATTYGDADLNAAATASSGLGITYESSDHSVATIVNGQIHIVGAGTVNITAKQPGDDNYGEAVPVTKQLVVNKADLTITATDKTWLQGTTMPTLTLTYSGFKYTDDETSLNPQPQVTTTATPTSPVGTYDIKVANAGSANYNLMYVWGKLTVVANKQPQTITFNALPAKTYGNADFSAGATVNSPLEVTYTSSNPAVATIINNTIHITGAGTTIITAKQIGDLTYEAATDVDQQLIVNKAPLTITADNKTRLIGHDNPPLTIVYSGFVMNETSANLITQPVVSTPADRSSLAGNYVIKVESATADNYDITHVNGVLTVTPLPAQVITFANLPGKKYGDVNFKPGASASSGLAVSYTSNNPAVATIVGDSIHITGAGTAQITATQQGNAFTAPATAVSRTLTVQKATLNIRADNKSKNEGEANPPFTVTYTGFVNNEEAGVLTSQPTVTTTATAISLAGTYGLVAQGAASNNYTIQYQQGVLTILPPQGEGQDNVNAYMSAPGQLQVNAYVVSDVKTAVQLFDLNGTRLVNTAISMKKGFNTYRLAIGNLAPGIYNLRVAGNGVMLKTKLVIR